MGCANSKTGATGAAAPEEGEAAAGAPPKVAVDGEAQDGAANGNAVSCSNGADESAGEKEACNGDVKNNDESEATPGGEKASEQNGGGEGESSTQDGGENNEAASTEEDAKEAEEESSENAESRENNDEEEKAE